MTPAATDRQGDLGMIFDWIVALRDGDIESVAELLDVGVVWHGVGNASLCIGRAAVLDVVREQLPLCLDVDAFELIGAPNGVVVGTRSRHLPQPPGSQLEGQIYNVFEQHGRRYSAIRDFVLREEALQCAGVREPAWR